MKILSYLNVSNLDNIESDSGYIFNYTLAYALRNRGEHFSIILPYEMKGLSTRFSDDMCFYAKMGKTKYEARFFIDWIRIANIVAEYKPDVILLNQSELTAAFRSMLNDNGLGRVKIIAYCHYPALHFENGNSILDYSLNDGNVAQSIVFSILTGINIADAFVIQSAFARNLLLNYAKKHNITLKHEINVFPPPYDTSFYTEKIEIKHSAKVLYNHRLYDSYGTMKFIDFVKANSDIDFMVTDPMINRCEQRSKYNNTPAKNRCILSGLKNVELIDGSNRTDYRNAIDMSRLAIAPYRPACVWSMSIIDCYGCGTPVIAPALEAFRDLVPENLLFASEEQERQLIEKLINNDDYWLKSVNECREKLVNISPEKIADGLLSLI